MAEIRHNSAKGLLASLLASRRAIPKSSLPKAWYCLPDNPADGLLTPEEWVTIGSTFALTARELDVAILLFEDRTRASVARKLSRSSGGVRKRIDKVFKKMNVRGKLGLVQRVWQVHRKLFSAPP